MALSLCTASYSGKQWPQASCQIDPALKKAAGPEVTGNRCAGPNKARDVAASVSRLGGGSRVLVLM